MDGGQDSQDDERPGCRQGEGGMFNQRGGMNHVVDDTDTEQEDQETHELHRGHHRPHLRIHLRGRGGHIQDRHHRRRHA